ncbi:hypothetical protein Q3G72_010848 [Acer saccharum]|nr:hypothetical protein Q3G72_010848 [Acer saccharum]
MKLPRVFDDMVDGDKTLDGNRCVVGGVEATHDGFDGGGTLFKSGIFDAFPLAGQSYMYASLTAAGCNDYCG